MNLAITPIGINHTPLHPNSRTNNSQSQNFGALPATFKPQISVPRDIDIVLVKFLDKFEEAAQRIGLNTKKLEKQGYTLVFDSTKTEDMDLRILHGVLKNKNGDVVKGNGKNVSCIVSECSETENAENFANKLNQLNILL